MSRADDNGEWMRALFHGLCGLWDIDLRVPKSSGEPWDFMLAVPWQWVYVVIVPEPAARQVEIDVLAARGYSLLILDDWDLNELRRAQNKIHAGEQIRWWVQRDGVTHASQERQRLGIAT